VLLTAAAYVLMQELRLQAAFNRLCAGLGLDVARTLPETERVGDGLGAAHRRASSGIVSVCDAFRQIALALGTAAR